MNIILKPKNVLRFLILLIICINIFYIVCQYFKFYLGHSYLFGFSPLFDLNLEGNVPTLFSSLILLFSSIILTTIALLTKRDNRRYFLHWFGLAIVFFFLFIDESVALHEMLTNPLRLAFNTSELFYYAWIIPYGILLLLFVIGYYRFIFHLPAQTRFFFIVAGITYITGAIGFEMLGGYYHELYDKETMTYAILVLFEESLEMTGIVIFIYSLLSYLAVDHKKLQINIFLKN